MKQGIALEQAPIEAAEVAPLIRRPKRTSRKKPLRLYAERLLLLLVVLLLWQLTSGRLLPTYAVSNPVAVAQEFWQLVTGHTLWPNLAITLEEASLGLVLGSVSGIIVGVLLGWFPRIATIVDPFMVAIYGLPKLALVPMFILWFGIELKMKVAFASVVVFFLVMWNAYAGIRAVDQGLVDVVRVTGAKWHQLLRYVMMPSGVEWILLGLKLATPYAVVGAVVAEMLASNSGLGYLLLNSAASFDAATLMALLVILMIISAVLNQLLVFAERRLLVWKR